MMEKKLPEGWEWKRLGDVVEILDSQRIPIKEDERKKRNSDKSSSDLIPYYGATGQVGWIDDYIFDEGLVLLGEDGVPFFEPAKNKSYIITGKSWVNNHVHVLRAEKSVILNLFLCNYLNIFNYNGYVTGTTRAKLNKSRMSKISIPLPPLETQRKIVAILEKADETKRLRVQADELTDRLLQSVFLEMFGDPVKNPMGWELSKFNKIGTLERGKSKHRPRNAPELLGGPYPLIQTGDIANSGIYIREYFQSYSELGLSQSRIWPSGTLCITIAANIAKTGILTFDACFPDSVVGFTPYINAKTEYVHFWLSFLQKMLEEFAPESAQKNINLKILSDLDVPVPPIELQNKFAQIVEKVEAMRQNQKQSQQEIDNLFNALMQKAFAGELIT